MLTIIADSLLMAAGRRDHNKYREAELRRARHTPEERYLPATPKFTFWV